MYLLHLKKRKEKKLLFSSSTHANVKFTSCTYLLECIFILSFSHIIRLTGLLEITITNNFSLVYTHATHITTTIIF